MEQILREGLAALGLECDDEALDRLRRYAALLEEKNRVMNLTAIEGEEAVARLHFLDCAALLTLPDFRGGTLLDVGSGAGFPGLVLKILRPALAVTLLDSLDKRVTFQRETGAALGLEGLSCVHGRAEEPPAGFRGGFDLVTSRAVARLSVLCELCLPLVRVGGRFLAMKGPSAEEELAECAAAVRLLGGGEARIVPYTVPGTDAAHSVVVIEKRAPTPPQYPRRWAQIKKAPLR